MGNLKQREPSLSSPGEREAQREEHVEERPYHQQELDGFTHLGPQLVDLHCS